MRNLIAFFVAILAASVYAADISVTSPGAGDFLGTTNTVKFTITDSVLQVTVKVVATLDSDPNIKVQVEDKFDPDVNGKIDSSLALNFATSTPEGSYTIKVTATETGNTFNDVPAFGVNVDVQQPKLLDFNPISGAYVRGVVPIVVELDETNLSEWRVRINNGDIPNNIGSTNSMFVNWDTSSIVNDGGQTISLLVEDLAGNTTSKNISVTLDRVKPSSTIQTPNEGTRVRPNSRQSVVIKVEDQFNGSVHYTGVDVIVTTVDDVFIMRVPRRIFSYFGTSMNWTGRIRTNGLPDTFKIVASAVDLAGNVAVVQEVTISTNRSRSVDEDDEDDEDDN